MYNLKFSRGNFGSDSKEKVATFSGTRCRFVCHGYKELDKVRLLKIGVTGTIFG